MSRAQASLADLRLGPLEEGMPTLHSFILYSILRPIKILQLPMAQCANCSKRLRDGFVFVSPIDDASHFYSDVHRKSQLFELATKSDSGESYSTICAKCTSDLVAYVDELISETEACNASYIKFMTDVTFDIPTANITLQVSNALYYTVISLKAYREIHTILMKLSKD
jgi:hypothetical protein